MLLADGSWAHFALSNDGGACEGVAAAARGGVAGFGAAMLGALWAYNGWNEVTYVAEEVKDPQRNLPLALIGGIGVIALPVRLRQRRLLLRPHAHRDRQPLRVIRPSRRKSSRASLAAARRA